MSLTHSVRALVCAAVLIFGAGCSSSSEPSSLVSTTSTASVDAAADSAGSTLGADSASAGSTRGADSASAGSTRGADSASAGSTRGVDSASTTEGTPEQSGTSLAATADGAQVAVRTEPEGKVVETFANPTPTGVPLTFMVVSTAKDWAEVQLPVRPNGRTAWVPTDEVTLSEVPYSLKVSTKDNTLELHREGELVETFSVATGTGGTPTPQGTFYLNELITPTNEGYGPFAYGISAFSEKLTSFGGGPGQVGLHGTDDEDSIGQAISNGCIRMSNDAITKLSALLPLGTPIEIT